MIASYSAKTTPVDVLRCDHCGGAIVSLYDGMLFWRPDAIEKEGAGDLALCLAHTRCHVHARGEQAGEASAALFWFADWSCSLRYLASVTNYEWNANEMKRLAHIAWAAPLVASAKEQASSRAFSECY